MSDNMSKELVYGQYFQGLVLQQESHTFYNKTVFTFHLLHKIPTEVYFKR
jgi:hypothetical protein